MSAKRRIAEKALIPVVAAGASAAANYAVKKGPGFVEDTLLPKVREGAKSAGGAAEKLPDLAEKLPDKARSAVSGGGELAEQLTQKARGVTGAGGGDENDGTSRTGSLSTDELSQRVEERAKGRAKRRKATRR